MSERTAWLNGQFVAESDAKVSIFDRGVLFGDGVYDVATVVNGQLLDADYHLARLDRSCAAISLANPYNDQQWLQVMNELLQRNGVHEGLVYLQITRGAAERDFAFPKDTRPTAFAYARPKALLADPNAAGVRVITVPDIRWARRDIKSTSLLAPVLAKQEARRHQAFEAFMHENGIITEGSSSNAFIVQRGIVITPPLTHSILPGITRHVALDLAQSAGIPFEQRSFSVAEALAADEVFLSSATNFVLPIIDLDGQRIGTGAPGPVTIKLRELYIARVLSLTTKS